MEDKEKTPATKVKKGKTSFIKKTDDSPLEQEVKSQSVYDKERDIYFVNANKLRRAQEIVDLINGRKVPNKSEEVQRIDHYKQQLAKHGVELDGPDTVPAVYEILGGETNDLN